MHRSHFVSALMAGAVVLTLPATPLLRAADDPGGARMGQFGTAIAMAGDVTFVGEPTGGKTPGTVHVYRRTPAGSWREAAKLTAPDGAVNDGFGAVLATNGSTLLVYATTTDSSRGAVFAYRKQADGSWKAAGRVGAEKPEANSRYGSALALAGNDALLGVARERPGGAVHVYRLGANGEWSHAGALVAESSVAPNPGDQFGAAVTVNGDLAAVGAPGRDGKGAVYLFRRSAAGAWAPEGPPLSGRNLPPNGQFGTSMLIDGNHLYVAAPNANSAAGMVVMFERDAQSGNWTEKATLSPFELGANNFGRSMAKVGNELWIGAPLYGRAMGTIYRVAMDKDGGWTGMTRFTPEALEGVNLFGFTMAASDNSVAVGMPQEGGGLGTTVFLARSATGAWTVRSKVFTPIEEYQAVTTGAVRCGANGMAANFQCSNTELASFLPISAIGGKRGTHLNDNWGWTDPAGGHEYALIGRTDGTSFLDITDPVHPRYLGDLPLTKGATPNAWRDIKTYKNFAFIVADGAGQHGMQVFDLTRLRSVKTPQTFTEDAHYDKIGSAHNIVINPESGFAYAVGVNSGGETCGGGLHMIDIRDPLHPAFAGCFADTATGRSKTGYSHDAMCINYKGPDTRYQGREICVGSNETAISIADVTDKQHPVALAHADYPDVGYTHQAWITDDQRYLYVDDELDEMNGKGEAAKGTRTLVWDLGKLDDPVLIKQYVGVSKSIDHNLYVKGNRIYEANYTSGLRILDISDPTNPHEVGFFDVYPDGDPVQFDGAWSNYPYFKSGTIIVTGIGQGVFFVRDRTKIVP
jgi:choice-of-anchor B domain-containing protein